MQQWPGVRPPLHPFFARRAAPRTTRDRTRRSGPPATLAASCPNRGRPTFPPAIRSRRPCDTVIAANTSSFVMTSAKIEVSHEASGLIHFVQPIRVNKAKERFFTARPTAATRRGTTASSTTRSRWKNWKPLPPAWPPATPPTQCSPCARSKRNPPAHARRLDRGGDRRAYPSAIRRKVCASEDYAEGIRPFKKVSPQFKGR